jgi:hypothetical protein
MTIVNTSHKIPNLGNGCKVIFGAIVGSHAYGTNVEGSDIDRKWIYVQSPMDLFVNGYREQVEINKDEVAIELSRFLQLAKKANPTMLELLFTPNDCVIYEHPTWSMVRNMRKTFLTKECRYSFVGYAMSQIEKARGLDKKMNWEKENTTRKSVLDFCYYIDRDVTAHDRFISSSLFHFFTLSQVKQMGLSAIPHTRDLYNVFWDSKYQFKGIVQDPFNSNDISVSDVPKDAHCVGMLFFNKDAYQIHCKKYKEYIEWLEKRNTQRYVDIEGHGQQIDGKNLLHCVRLIETGWDIASFGELWVRRQNADFLIEIRKGKHNLEKIIEHSQKRLEEMDEAFMKSDLPAKFREDAWLKAMNYQVRQNIYQEDEHKSKTELCNHE